MNVRKRSNSTRLKRKEPKGTKGRRTKALIQDAVVDLVSVDGLGLNDIKMDRICKKAGVTIGAFYFHFENKDSAIQETAVDVLHEFKAEVESIPHQDDLLAELREIILVYIHSIIDRPKHTQLVYAAIRSSPAVHKAYERMHFDIADRLEAMIAAARIEAGTNASESQLIVEFLMAGIESFIENVYMWDNEKIARLGDRPELLAHKLAVMWVNLATTQLSVNQ